MSEYFEYALGVNDVRKDLEQIGNFPPVVDVNQALATFKELILSRPDVGKSFKSLSRSLHVNKCPSSSTFQTVT